MRIKHTDIAATACPSRVADANVVVEQILTNSDDTRVARTFVYVCKQWTVKIQQPKRLLFGITGFAMFSRVSWYALALIVEVLVNAGRPVQTVNIVALVN